MLLHAKRLGEHSFSLVMMSLMYLDASDAKTPKNACLQANGSNRAVSERLGEFSAFFAQNGLGTLLFTCYDGFDVIGGFAEENI